MGLADVWSRTLVYFGIAEEDDDDWDEDGYATHEELERTYAERPNATVRRLQPRRRRNQEFDDWTESEPAAQPPPQRTASVRHLRRSERNLEVAPEPAMSPSVQVHLVVPRSFNDAQQIADRFKDGVPVILNLQGTDTELSKRLIDFASGLTYALDGGMQRVADKVFLLTPRNVSVSAEERARMLERGFFNPA
jgi:cell division inhibitor SepF